MVTIEGEFFNGVATAVLRIGAGKGDAPPFAIVVGHFIVADVEMGKPGGGPADTQAVIVVVAAAIRAVPDQWERAG